MSPTPTTAPSYITAQHLADVWSVSPRTVYRWGADGWIPREVLGPRAVRFPRSLLTAPAPTAPTPAPQEA